MPDENRFTADLRELLQRLSDPVTPYTATELRCRIEAFGWDRCLPILRSELQSTSGDVQRLVLGVISEEADQSGAEAVVCLLPQITNCLSSQDRHVRQAAVLTIGSLGMMTEKVSDTLRNIITQDELATAREALTVLIELDDSLVSKIVGLLRKQ